MPPVCAKWPVTKFQLEVLQGDPIYPFFCRTNLQPFPTFRPQRNHFLCRHLSLFVHALFLTSEICTGVWRHHAGVAIKPLKAIYKMDIMELTIGAGRGYADQGGYTEGLYRKYTVEYRGGMQIRRRRYSPLSSLQANCISKQTVTISKPSQECEAALRSQY